MATVDLKEPQGQAFAHPEDAADPVRRQDHPTVCGLFSAQMSRCTGFCRCQKIKFRQVVLLSE